MAADPDSKVLGLVAYAWAGFGAAFGPVVILSVLWKRMTEKGALAGMIVGAVVVVLWAEYANPALKAAGLQTMYEIVPGFIACTLAVIAVSLMDKEPSKEIQERFEKADADYHAAK